ncbi:MAG: methylmalonyl-CoA epimerase [Actinobacteria bacterium]|nr:methylmalonyl-CoA epimerase [Actinomycetota bacterium]
MELTRIEQVAFAVDDLDVAIALWEGVFGAELEGREVIETDLVEEAMLRVGDGYIQLVAPTSEGSTVARFLDRHGPGMHHVAFAVPSVADALAELRDAGVRLIDTVPRRGGGGHTVAFVHPASTGGVLVELVEDGQASEQPATS